MFVQLMLTTTGPAACIKKGGCNRLHCRLLAHVPNVLCNHLVFLFLSHKKISYYLETKMTETLKNPFTLVLGSTGKNGKPIPGLQEVMLEEIPFGKRSGEKHPYMLYGIVAVLVVLVSVQYYIKHIHPEDDRGWEKSPQVIESNPTSTKRPDRMMKRFSDAFTCVALVLILFALFKTGGYAFIPCLFFIFVSSIFARFCGEALAYGCGDKPATCTGLQDWPFFLLVSFIMIYGLSVTSLQMFMAVFLAVAALGAGSGTVSLFNKDKVTSHDTGKGFIVADTLMQYAVFIGVLIMFIKSYNGNKGTSTPFGMDASSVY